MKKIAVVEDNPDNRELIWAILSGDFEVTLYGSGPEALSGFHADLPELVLLDISLPQMDGPEVVRHIRADSVMQGLPVIALTAHAMPGDREKYLALGFNDYVTKPILDEKILLDAIERWLEGRAGTS